MTIIYFGIAIIIILLITLLFKKQATNPNQITQISQVLSTEIARIEASVKNEIASNRKETSDQARLARGELASSLISFEEKLNHLTNTIDLKLTAFNEGATATSITNRNEIKAALDAFKKDLSQSIRDFNSVQRDNFYSLLQKQSEQNTTTTQSLENMRQTVEQKIKELQAGNEQKLEQMRVTVDEKLQQTLETRLGESFKLVSDRLEAVHKGLGDMQTLATGVGDLKRVLTNVKTRGVMGEYQLENILEQTLTADQYSKNVKTKTGSRDHVEFAIKMPGKENILWLPVDSKFPKEDYELLMNAYEVGDASQIEDCRKTFVKGIKKCAQDISSKYIDPPNTTDFALLFLPFESLYAEVLRTPGLFENIRLECRINITGPTTLSAFLSSLQMGFRTLAIEKRSSEVWNILGAVKTEFKTFSNMLEKAQKNIQTGLGQLEDVAGVRTRSIQKKLQDVETIEGEKEKMILPDASLYSEEN